MLTESNAKLNIPFFSFEQMNASFDLIKPINRVLKSGWYVLGQEVEAFEQAFAAYIGVEYCVSVANGTEALELGLRSVGVAKGDTVLVVANAGFYSSTALHLIGAIPHYIDIDLTTLTMSVEKMQEALKIKPKAIVVTHLYGQLAQIEKICAIASNLAIPVIEDCAQAHGAKRNNKRGGSFGQVACFSFYPTKNLGAIGDGGALVTGDKENYEKLKKLRQYGWQQKYHVEQAYARNSRLDEIQAAVLSEKLPFLDGWNQQRRDIAIQYNDAWKNLPIICPGTLTEENVVHLYTVQVENRKDFCTYLKQHNIHTDIHYPIPDHLQVAYPCAQTQGMLPNTEKVCAQIVSLPCYPGLSAMQVNKIMDTVKNYFSGKSK